MIFRTRDHEYSFRRVSFSDMSAYKEFEPLAKAYRSEVGNKDYLDGVLSRDTYVALDEADKMRFYVILEDDEKLVGIVTLMFNNVLHSTMLSATIESFYLSLEARKGGLARWVLEELKGAAKEKGAPGFLVTAPKGSRMDRWMMALGMLPAYVGYYVSGASE